MNEFDLSEEVKEEIYSHATGSEDRWRIKDIVNFVKARESKMVDDRVLGLVRDFSYIKGITEVLNKIALSDEGNVIGASWELECAHRLEKNYGFEIIEFSRTYVLENEKGAFGGIDIDIVVRRIEDKKIFFVENKSKVKSFNTLKQVIKKKFGFNYPQHPAGHIFILKSDEISQEFLDKNHVFTELRNKYKEQFNILVFKEEMFVSDVKKAKIKRKLYGVDLDQLKEFSHQLKYNRWKETDGARDVFKQDKPYILVEYNEIVKAPLSILYDGVFSVGKLQLDNLSLDDQEIIEAAKKVVEKNIAKTDLFEEKIDKVFWAIRGFLEKCCPENCNLMALSGQVLLQNLGYEVEPIFWKDTDSCIFLKVKDKDSLVDYLFDPTAEKFIHESNISKRIAYEKYTNPGQFLDKNGPFIQYHHILLDNGIDRLNGLEFVGDCYELVAYNDGRERLSNNNSEDSEKIFTRKKKLGEITDLILAGENMAEIIGRFKVDNDELKELVMLMFLENQDQHFMYIITIMQKIPPLL